MQARRSQHVHKLGTRANSAAILTLSNDELVMRVEVASNGTSPFPWKGRLSARSYIFQYDRSLKKSVIRIPADIWNADAGYIAHDILDRPDIRYPMVVFPEKRPAVLQESDRFVPDPTLAALRRSEEAPPPVDPQPDPEPVVPSPEIVPELPTIEPAPADTDEVPPDHASPIPTPDPEAIQSDAEDAILFEQPKKRGRKPKPTE